MDKTPAESIDAYIAQFPAATQKLLQQMRAIIKKAAPAAHETISYKMPAFVLHKNLVYFAGYKNHIWFYPGAAGISHFKQEIAAYKNAKGSVRFPLNQPLPAGLITKIVKFRVKQNTEKL